jgi:Na+-translocating ferredoxin:NAD+ oxidoreductase subunit B
MRKRLSVALIDESRCIGCTLCMDACPVDAIVGAQTLMHTVVEPWCIGCALCVPPCPVDCIEMLPPRGPWTNELKQSAKRRALHRKQRLSAQPAPQTLSSEQRRAVIAASVARKRR